MSPIWVRDTSKRRSLADVPQADNTAATRGTITPHQVELAHDLGRIQPRSTAEREPREAPQVDAAAHREEPHALGHGRVRRRDGCLAPPRAAWCQGPQRYRRPRFGGGCGRSAAGRPESPQASRLPSARLASVTVASRPPSAIAGRPGTAPALSRADMQVPPGVDPGNRATAGADAGDVETVQGRCVWPADSAIVIEASACRRRSAEISCWCRPCRTGSDALTDEPRRRTGCPRPAPAPTAPPPPRAAPPRRSAPPRHATGRSGSGRDSQLRPGAGRAAPGSATAPGRHRR